MDSHSSPHPKTAASDAEHHRKKPSNSELLSSAKLVAGAASAAIHGETDKINKGQVAGAAADILGAASHYGKLEGKGVGKYVGQAEDYLHRYHTSHPTAVTGGDSGHKTTTTSTTAAASSSAAHTVKPQPKPKPKPATDEDEESGSGGFGDYIKLAEGFLKKR